jgi:hypothetical protein
MDVSDRIVVEGNTEERPARRPAGRSPLPLLAAIALVVGLGGVVFGGAEAPPSTTEVPAPSVSAPPFVVPTGSWSELPVSGAGTFTAVADGPGGLVAVGAGRRLDDPPVVWHSADGTAWTEVSGPWEPGDVVVSVVAHRGRFVAAGYALDTTADDMAAGARPQLWVSGNGVSWGELRAAGLPPEGAITRLAVAGDRLVALGFEGEVSLEPLFPPGPDSVGSVWTSDDGVAWVDRTPPGPPHWFTDVAVSGPTLVVAGSGDDDAFLWLSEDGGAWRSLRSPVRSEVPELASVVTSTADGFVAVVRPRSDPHGLPTTWRVRPSGTWTRIEPTERPMDVGWILPIDGGYLAGPSFTRYVFSTGPELRASPDTVEWTGVEITSGPSPWPPTLVTSAVRFDGRLMVFGSRGGQAAGWVLDPEGT